MALENPLNEQDYQTMEANLQRLRDLQAELSRAQSAGVDVAERKKQVSALITNINKLKAAYFPGR